MINLIPNQEKKQMVSHFNIRLLIVFLTTITVTFFIGAVALLPAYFFSVIKKEISNNKLAEQRKAPLPQFSQDSLAIVQDFNNKFKILEEAGTTDKFIVSQRAVNELVLKKPPEIKLTQITYIKNSSGVKTITVRGFAPSRESLLAFRFMLENNPSFKNVELPISSFIKGTNIQFFLTLSPA